MTDPDLSCLPRSKQEAKQIGALYYFTGNPCKQGHVSKKLTSNSGCAMCRADERIRHRDRYIARKKIYRAENLEKCREGVRQWKRENPERAKQKKSASQKKHWDKALIRHKKWRDENRDKTRAWSDRYNKKNKEAVKAMIKDWVARNPEKVRTSTLNRVARKKNAEGFFTKSDIEKLKIEQNNLCAACCIDISKKYHIDHIMPLFLGGSNWPENLQLLCPACNCSKGPKHPDEWKKNFGALPDRLATGQSAVTA